MTEAKHHTQGIVHLAVAWNDNQRGFLDPKNMDNLRRRVRQFADQLANVGIPTIWTCYAPASHRTRLSDANNEITNGKILFRAPKHLHEMGFWRLRLRQNEDLLIHGSVDSFADGTLNSHLQDKYKAHTLLITGGLTLVDIRSAVTHGMRHGYDVIAVQDSMFSVNREWTRDPKEHERELLYALSQVEMGPVEKGVERPGALDFLYARDVTFYLGYTPK